MDSFGAHSHKKKVVFVMGATGTGKSRLSIDIATRFGCEIINSDKMQVYKSLAIVTNKVTESECQGVPHHLLGFVEDPEADFTASDFCHHALIAIDNISKSGAVPVIVGGSNSFIEALVENDHTDNNNMASSSANFKSMFECCFVWLHVSPSVLHSFVSTRVDQMVNAGVIDEIRDIYVPGADYSRGVRRSIGVPELDKYYELERKDDVGVADLETVFNEAIEEVKRNTCKLIANQMKKIDRLREERGWVMHRIDATCVFERLKVSRGKEEVDETWDEIVKKPCLEIVADFLEKVEEVDGPQNAISSDAMSNKSLGELQVVVS